MIQTSHSSPNHENYIICGFCDENVINVIVVLVLNDTLQESSLFSMVETVEKSIRNHRKKYFRRFK